ncbi:hypothetical protein UFOVP188_27 [uncultured Caudovirales phage]|uniref:Uncharacterized protein n=1 Tax=uncultured Caudovirales phage TaxID=2100421 RepID=A0A6J7WEU6_9CAUD|nr:hypothetical protein UFOVP188_27 [uncultured Caudovirales phage]
MNWVDTTAKFLKELFKPKTINEIIAKELRESHLKKLEAESAVEYARSIVVYNEQRIKRLEQRLTEHTSEGDYA